MSTRNEINKRYFFEKIKMYVHDPIKKNNFKKGFKWTVSREK